MGLPLPHEVKKVLEELPVHTEAIVSRLDRVIELLEQQAERSS